MRKEFLSTKNRAIKSFSYIIKDAKRATVERSVAPYPSIGASTEASSGYISPQPNQKNAEGIFIYTTQPLPLRQILKPQLFNT
jgi:hypothetical protein